jgi:ADP-ribose pyrophosphatase YjhB (NUDIX family)
MTGQPRPGQPGWTEPEQWYAQLATQYAAAGALLTDPDGKILLVKPNYREYWTLPGGMVDHGETPEQALHRELKEELGLDLAVGPLLVIDWAPAYAQRPRPIVYFLFDAGVLDPGTDIRLQEAELDEYAYVAPGQVAARAASYTAARLPAALSARATGTTLYLPQQARPGT